MLSINSGRSFKIFFLFTGLLFSTVSQANWTLNLGYHNPPNATVGVNFLYLNPTWAFEIGLGWVDASSEDSQDTANDTTSTDSQESVTLKASGALNVKFFLGYGGIRPYVQLGAGAGIGAKAGDENDFGASVGGGYGGVGLFMGSSSLYVYGSYNFGSYRSNFVQAGFGFDI